MATKQVRWPIPKMFIGSSGEAFSVVKAFCEAFAKHAECVPWNKAPQFSAHGSFPTFTALCNAAQQYDFALFILTPDDQLVHRGTDYRAPRDNVVFEMGLFIAAIGPERVFGVAQESSSRAMKIPSDLAGVNMPRFQYAPRRRQTSLSSIKGQIDGFVKSIQDRGFREFSLPLAQSWGYNKDERRFEVILGSGHLTEHRLVIGTMHVAIGARLKDPVVNFEDDDKVVYSPARALPQGATDMAFHIPGQDFHRAPKTGDRLQFRVVLLPAAVKIRQFSTLKDAIRNGCKSVQRGAVSVDLRKTT
jgi:hypothetical protein